MANKAPFVINLDSQCNQRCLFCMKQEPIESNRNISYQDVCGEIKKAKNRGYGYIDFYGGEPLTYPFIVNSIKLANTLDLGCYLATNGIRFSSRSYAEVFFSKIKIKEIRISLHSHRAEIHDKITQVKGSFKKTISGIRNIMSLGKTKIRLTVVVNSLNYKDSGKIVDFVDSLGQKDIIFSGLVIEGRIKEHMSLAVDPDLVHPHLLGAVKKCTKLGIGLRIMKMPVCILSGSNFNVGNIIQEEDILNFRKLFFCRDCAHWSICIGFEKHTLKHFDVPSFASLMAHY